MTAKKRIGVLQAHVPFVHGGAELLVTRLTEQLILHGYEAEIISVPYKWYPGKVVCDSMLTWRLMDLSESNGRKIDLVIATKFPTYGARHDNKIVWLVHQERFAYDLYDRPYGFSQEKNGALIKQQVEQFDAVTLGEAKKIYTISKNNTKRLKEYNGIDSLALHHPPPLFGRYFCEMPQKYILSVGRLEPMKRVDLLIRALPFCDKSVTVKIAGTGSSRHRLEALSKELNVADRVEFLGFVSEADLLELYANAAAVFFAPLDEDYGYITLEAFLSAKPIITCSDSGEVLEFVKAEESGFICDLKPESIASAMNFLIQNKEKSVKMGLQGLEQVKDISWKSVISHLTSTI